MQLSVSLDQLKEGINKINQEILLIKNRDNIVVIKNACPHFGVPLDNNSVLTDPGIKCYQHGIEFSLESGEQLNRKYEDCDKLIFYPYKTIGNNIIITL